MHKIYHNILILALSAMMILGFSFAASANGSDPSLPSYGPFGLFESASTESTDSVAGTPAQGTSDISSLAEDVQQIINSSSISLMMLQPDLSWTPACFSSNGAASTAVTTDNQGFVSISMYAHSLPGDILYRTYSSGSWSIWKMNGAHSPWTAGVRIEAVQIRLGALMGKHFDVYYSATLSDGTVCDWSRNGATNGSISTGQYITALQIALYPRGTGPSANSSGSVLAAAYEGIRFDGGLPTYSSGTGLPYTGWVWYDNTTRYYFVDSVAVTGWQSIDGYRYFFESDGKLVTDLEPYLNSGGPFFIRINKEMNCMTVFVQDETGNFSIPYKVFLCSTGDDTPIGIFHTPAKYRWQLMNTGEYCQFCTRLGSGLHILMHSVIYESPNPYSLKNSTYNYLGYNRSHGCIRLTTRDARWLYEHCPVGTSVEVYQSAIPGPYDRPGIDEFVTDLQTWDPTDIEVPENAVN